MDIKLPVQQIVGPYSPIFFSLRLSDTGSHGTPTVVIQPEEHLRHYRNSKRYGMETAQALLARGFRLSND